MCHSMCEKQIIHFSDEAYQHLRNYVTTKYGKHRAISFVVQQAAVQFPESEKVAREEREQKNLKYKRPAPTGLFGVGKTAMKLSSYFYFKLVPKISQEQDLETPSMGVL